MDLYVGIMSGTSLDGVDAVLVGFNEGKVSLIETHSQLFPADLKEDLDQLVKTFTVNLSKLGEIDHRLGLCYADCSNELLEKAEVRPEQVKAIGCHGQTIFHSPDSKYPFTMQIGDGNLISAKTGIITVADFRRMDMAFGGGGAPLAPAFHQGFLNSKSEKRGILNLGGIANITIVADDENNVIGFDTGPANCLMDSWIQNSKGEKFDKDGEWAKSGVVIEGLLSSLLAEEYFQLSAPKSTGRELFNMNWLKKYLDLLPDYNDMDVQATLLELTAVSVAQAVRAVAPDVDAIYVCGGGAFNVYLLERMSFYMPGVRIGLTDELGVSVQWVEAIAFGWLAMRRMEMLPGNLSSVTGASKNVLLGAVYQYE